jgi:hypothetical protein
MWTIMVALDVITHRLAPAIQSEGFSVPKIQQGEEALI